MEEIDNARKCVAEDRQSQKQISIKLNRQLNASFQNLIRNAGCREIRYNINNFVSQLSWGQFEPLLQQMTQLHYGKSDLTVIPQFFSVLREVPSGLGYLFSSNKTGINTVLWKDALLNIAGILFARISAVSITVDGDSKQTPAPLYFLTLRCFAMIDRLIETQFEKQFCESHTVISGPAILDFERARHLQVILESSTDDQVESICRFGDLCYSALTNLVQHVFSCNAIVKNADLQGFAKILFEQAIAVQALLKNNQGVAAAALDPNIKGRCAQFYANLYVKAWQEANSEVDDDVRQLQAAIQWHHFFYKPTRLIANSVDDDSLIPQNQRN